MGKPFFSILLPTRNRADMLVDSALRSVLNSSFDEFNVVGCGTYSTEHTRDVEHGLLSLEEVKTNKLMGATI